MDALVPVPLPTGQAPLLAILVDTEEEFDWRRPLARENTAVSNLAAQIRGQEIIDKYGGHATYAATYPVLCNSEAVSHLVALTRSSPCEIGAHLHPWVTPPHGETVSAANSYGCNLPPALERAKIATLAAAAATATGARPAVFRAGRYGLGARTLAMLAEAGFTVDSSIVPATAFDADGGPDFRALDPGLKRFRGDQNLLEVPLSCGFTGHLRPFGGRIFPRLEAPVLRRGHAGGILARLRLLERIRLTPEGTDLGAMIRLTRALLADGIRVFCLSYHSPSMVPGFTPYVRDRGELDAFLTRLEDYLAFFTRSLGGRTVLMSELGRLVPQAALT